MINNWFFIFVGSILAGILFSCQVVPTKTSNQGEVVAQQKQDSIKVFFKLSPVILDARSPLDFSVSHAPGAIPAQWDEFTKVEPGYRGILQDDDLSLARRLSLWGIDQDTPVLVLGNALQGLGEEARVAWTLKFLGVKNVQFGSWSLVRSTIPRPGMSPENKPIWKPTPQTELLATAEEFKAAVFKFVLLPSKARLKSLQLDSVNAGILKSSVQTTTIRQ